MDSNIHFVGQFLKDYQYFFISMALEPTTPNHQKYQFAFLSFSPICFSSGAFTQLFSVRKCESSDGKFPVRNSVVIYFSNFFRWWLFRKCKLSPSTMQEANFENMFDIFKSYVNTHLRRISKKTFIDIPYITFIFLLNEILRTFKLFCFKNVKLNLV